MTWFVNTLAARATPQFETEFKREFVLVPVENLPLQAALAHSSQLLDGSIEPVVLSVEDTDDSLRIKTAIFYAGVDAGSCCADDPSPPCQLTEYCEVLVIISKATGLVEILPLDF